MFTRRQEGVLARTHEGEPGLPRGKNRLPPAEVRAAQRARLLGAAIAAVAAEGYSEVTVADIVRGARVSRAAFYAHFADKEDCFIAACREGGQLMIDGITAAKRSLPAGASAEQVLRVSLIAFLDFLAHAVGVQARRTFHIDMPASKAASRLAAPVREPQLRPVQPRLARAGPAGPAGLARQVPAEALLRAGGARPRNWSARRSART